MLCNCPWIFLFGLMSSFIAVAAVTRSADLNQALVLECREENFIKINNVKLGKRNSVCLYPLRTDHSDYIRVVSRCSGYKSCSNIVLQDSQRIPCGSSGIQASDFLEVDYACEPSHSMINVCHNTERTTSPFLGYISSPNYPSAAVDKRSQKSIVCSCEISTHIPQFNVEFQLLDVINSPKISIVEGGVSKPICSKLSSGKCINNIYTSRSSTVHLTYDMSSNLTFLIMFAAVNRESRVKAVCHLNSTDAEPTISTERASEIRELDSVLIENIEAEEISAEIIAGVVVAVVLVFTFTVIAVIYLCRKYRSDSQSSSPLIVHKTMHKRVYDLVPVDSGIIADNKKAENRTVSDHIYHEPCLTVTEYDIPPALHDYENALNERIYETVDEMDRQLPTKPTRPSHNKTSTMPQKPAPPIPRNAVPCKTPSYRQAAKPLVCDTKQRASSSHTYDVPCVSGSTRTADGGSFESIPSLKLDLTDVIIETGKTFETQRQNAKAHTQTSEYLCPKAPGGDNV